MLRNIDRLKKELEAVKTDIDRLSGFRDTSFTRRFRRQLEGEKSVLLQKIRNLTITKAEKAKELTEKIAHANRNRSVKNRRNWRYVEAIQQNYRPDLTKNEIRSMLKKHRQGLETDIPDVAWRNPSP